MVALCLAVAFVGFVMGLVCQSRPSVKRAVLITYLTLVIKELIQLVQHPARREWDKLFVLSALPLIGYELARQCCRRQRPAVESASPGG